MKKNFLAILVSTVLISCCSSDTRNQSEPVPSINSLGRFPYNTVIDELTVVTIDSCEYIVCNSFKNKDITITHKGNCNYCWLRKK